MSSSGLLNTLSTSDRQTIPARLPWASTTGSRRSLCADIRRAALATGSSGLVELTEQTQAAVKVEADRVLAALGGPHSESVTVKAVHGFPVEELVSASKDADIVVLGSPRAGRINPTPLGSAPGPGGRPPAR